MAQLSKGTTYTDTAPGYTVNATNLNDLVDDATVLNGAVIDQNDVSTRVGNTVPLAADAVLLGDSTQPDTAAPLKVRLDSLLQQSSLMEPVRNGTQQFAAGNSSGGGAAYILTLPQSIAAYATGMVIRFKADANNSAGVTVNVNTLGTVNVVDRTGTALRASAILSGQICEITYDGTNGWFVLGSATPVNSVPAASLTEACRDLAYNYQSSNTSHASSGGFDVYTVTLSPAPTQLIVGMWFQFLVPAGNTQPCKMVVNYASGNSGNISLVKLTSVPCVAGDLAAAYVAEVMYDGTNFRLKNPLANADFITGAQALPGTGGSLINVAHGLGTTPTRVRWVLQCVTTNAGYAVGDQVDASAVLVAGVGGSMYTAGANSTDIFLVAVNSSPQLYNKGTFAVTTLTIADWELIGYATL